MALILLACSSDTKSASPSPPSASSSVPPSAGDVNVRDGIVYAHAAVGAPAPGTADLALDLYEPEPAPSDPTPVVVLVHGGGFTMGSRTDAGIVRIARGLAAKGIAVASIDYRLQDQQPVPSPRVGPLVADLAGSPVGTAMVAAIDDTLAAIDYLRDHAGELHLDASRLGLVGSSAGAITVDHVAYVLDDHGIEAPKVRFVASLWGGIVARSPGSSGTSPADQVDEGEAALFAVHGDADTTVPVKLDDDLVARAKAVGITTEYQRIAGGEHGYARSQFFTLKVDGETPFDRLLRFAVVALQ